MIANHHDINTAPFCPALPAAPAKPTAAVAPPLPPAPPAPPQPNAVIAEALPTPAAVVAKPPTKCD